MCVEQGKFLVTGYTESESNSNIRNFYCTMHYKVWS